MKIAAYFGLTILLLGLLTALHIFIANYRAERADFARTPPTEISRHPERAGVSGLREVFFAAKGVPHVAGWYAPSRNRAAIVLVHGTQSERSSLLAETRILSEAGFGVLALDLPGQGASDGQSFWGTSERDAIIAGADWLSRREEVDPNRIGGFGLSMGAYVLTLVAALDKGLRAVTLAACPTDVVEQNWVTSGKWGLLSRLPEYWALRLSHMPLDMLPKNVIGAIAPRPVFILAGDLDGTVPEYMARELFLRAGNPKEMWIVHGAHHGDYASVAPEEYRLRLVDFFRRSLLN
jgi:dipeptidyl aminopeptidase/acylaminoacyl peptidase